MKAIILLFLLFFMLFSNMRGQEVSIIGAGDLERILSDSTDTLHVINFWATWCGPCVIELPHFEDVSKNFSERNVKFILVSLDFPSQLGSRLIPFVKEKNIRLKVVLLNELDYGKWMPLVDTQWKGNLPATLVFNNLSGKREFVPGALEKEEISNLIIKNL